MKRLFSTLFAIAFFTTVSAQDTLASTLRNVYIDIPLAEWPYQTEAIQTTGGFLPSYMNPGMAFSLTLSNSLYTAAHWGLQQIHYSDDPARQRYFQRLAVYGFDLVSTWMPLGYAWLHEEYHRAVMTHRGVNSFNEVLLFKVGSTVISVSHETDEDMARLCDEYHNDFIRLMAAGHEGQTLQSQRLQRDDFFYHQGLDNELLLLNNAINNTAYLATCAWGWGEKDIARMNAAENTITSRDFTGLDMMAWVHGLFNPDEPYAARGQHPSGVGIDRYITLEDLSPEAVGYLKRQTFIDLLNWLSPTLIGIARFDLGSLRGRHAYGNFAFRHYLTSFGDDNSLELLFQMTRPESAYPLNAYLVLHNYNNHRHHFAGVEAGIVDQPLLCHKLLLSANLHGWWQPAAFADAHGKPGGSITLRITANLHNDNSAYALCLPYLEMGYKTRGWMAGNVDLDATPYLNAGLRWRI